MKTTSISLFCLMKMLDKYITYIDVLVPLALFVSCLVSYANRITTWCCVSRSDTVYTTDWIYYIYNIRTLSENIYNAIYLYEL
jgi:hypothetical protein